MPESEQRIVVGLDGSEHSQGALRWALGQALLTGASVDAVTAWRYPTTYGLATVVPDIDLEAEATQMLTESLAKIAGDFPGARVQQLVGEGPPAAVLLRAAADADLLVVGSRGQGGFASAVLGSVSLACVLNAPCPILVYRDDPREDT
jgi:nucleotide-binding universal stress UspA family protein